MFDSLIAAFSAVFDKVAGASAPVWLTIFGLLLVAGGFLGLYKIINLDSKDTSTFLKFITSFLFLIGVLFAAAGPTAAYVDLSENKIRRVAQREAITRLRANEEVSWLIRFIVYNPSDPHNKTIGNLTKIGPDVDYTFVSPYDELKGYRVSEALAMVGAKPPIELLGSYRVSVIIFKVSSHIYPANVRGFLRVVKLLEDTNAGLADHSVIYPELNQKQINDLSTEGSLYYYTFDYMKDNYKQYCLIMQNLRCPKDKDIGSNSDSKASGVMDKISKLSRDWHPIGVALNYAETTCRANPNACDACINKTEICDITAWDDIIKFVGPNFGARIFLIENKSIKSLGQRYLLDVGPNDIIPEIGVE